MEKEQEGTEKEWIEERVKRKKSERKQLRTIERCRKDEDWAREGKWSRDKF